MSDAPAKDTQRLYRAAVGPKNTEFYVTRFLRFDQPGASRLSWNWPAFLVSFYWFLYRRMWGYWALYCVAIPLTFGFVSAMLASALGPQVSQVGNLVELVYAFGVLPVIANALYHHKIRQQIAQAGAQAPDPASQVTLLESGAHTSSVACLVALITVLVMVGILLAVRLPAYQDEAIRAEVKQGMALAAPVKGRVADRYAAGHSWPATVSADEIGQPMDDGNARLSVDHGTINIAFTGAVMPAQLSGHVLSVRPSISPEGAVVWSCGNAAPAGSDPPSGAAGANLTNVAPRYLPENCRGGGP
jgi:hypothetical protein